MEPRHWKFCQTGGGHAPIGSDDPSTLGVCWVGTILIYKSIDPGRTYSELLSQSSPRVIIQYTARVGVTQKGPSLNDVHPWDHSSNPRATRRLTSHPEWPLSDHSSPVCPMGIRPVQSGCGRGQTLHMDGAADRWVESRVVCRNSSLIIHRLWFHAKVLASISASHVLLERVLHHLFTAADRPCQLPRSCF